MIPSMITQCQRHHRTCHCVYTVQLIGFPLLSSWLIARAEGLSARGLARCPLFAADLQRFVMAARRHCRRGRYALGPTSRNTVTLLACLVGLLTYLGTLTSA